MKDAVDPIDRNPVDNEDESNQGKYSITQFMRDLIIEITENIIFKSEKTLFKTWKHYYEHICMPDGSKRNIDSSKELKQSISNVLLESERTSFRAGDYVDDVLNKSGTGDIDGKANTESKTNLNVSF